MNACGLRSIIVVPPCILLRRLHYRFTLHLKVYPVTGLNINPVDLTDQLCGRGRLLILTLYGPCIFAIGGNRSADELLAGLCLVHQLLVMRCDVR